MRKAIALILCLLMIPTFCFATELSEMTEQELYDSINEFRNELLNRIKDREYIVNDDYIQISPTLRGNADDNSFYYEVVFVNNSKRELGVSFDHIVINGWETDNFQSFSPIKAGRKSKETITFRFTDADLTTYRDIEEIALSFHIYDGDSYDTIKTYDDVLVDFRADTWH